ncbi:hypothetical protein DAD186_19980 [Dermabacter vaginalis]|uniref:Uncharacterized protein n=1 Tax=Dermabacter vaginalis TaxID=1630135 RepID=A0A1B0ZKY6_9MICO|nr:hypothetical protein DAD186_19980 [Dermabacter vaginalis]
MEFRARGSVNGLTKKPGRPGPSPPTELAGGEGGEKRR